MRSDYLPDHLKDLWQELSTNPVPVSIEELRIEAGKLRKGLRRRLVVGGSAALIVAVAWVVFFFIFPNAFQRIGSVMTIVGAGYLIGQIPLRRSRVIPHTGETECLRFYRAELERQRDFHRGPWFWSRLAFFLPGPLVGCVGFAQAHPELGTYIWLEAAALLILAGLAVPLNLRLARRYQRRLDALDRSEKDA